MSRQRDLDKLLSDLRSFLLILDRESLSTAARAKKKSVSDLLSRLQSPPSEDAEYMIMRCLSPSPGTPRGRTGPGSWREDAAGACESCPGSALSLHRGNKAPGIPPCPPADDSYEDAEAPGQGRTGGGDSDSSHYESYGEEEEEEEEEGVTDRAHYLRWPSATSAEAEPPAPPEAQLCGFLWRKRWLGQWAKQLFIVREHVLLCFRCAADLQPVLELDLRGCRVTYKDKRGKKMPHALKVTGTTGEVLVIGFQSRQQAEDWRKVIEEVSSDAPSGLAALSVPASPSSRLSRLGKEEEEEKNRSRQSPARSPRPGKNAKGGFPAVPLRGRWRRLWCAARRGALRMFPEPGAARSPGRPDGCQVSPGAAAGSPQNLRIRIAQRGRELALLQTRSDEEREAWLKTLQARGGVEPKKGDGPPPRPPRPSSRPAAGGLLLRRVPTPNTYMDDPFGQPPPAETPKHLYSNAERLQQLQQSLDGAAQGQRRRPVSALPTCAISHAPGGARPSQAAPPGALRARPASAQLPKDNPDLQSRDFSLSQHTLTLPERKGPREGLDALGIGRSTGSSVPVPGAAGSRPQQRARLRRARAWQRSRCPCREKSLSQAGGEGGAAGEPREGQAESRLRDEPAGPGEVTEGSHRRHRRFGWLRGIVPQAAAEAHHVSEERPEAAPIPAHRGQGKCDAEDKGMGDEICDVIRSLLENIPENIPCSPGEHRAACGSCRTSLDSAWNLTFIHHYQRYNYAHLFFISRYIGTHISAPHPWVSSLPLMHPHPSQLLFFGVHNSRVHPSSSFLGYTIPGYISAPLFWSTQFPGTFQLLFFGVHNSRVHSSSSFFGYTIPGYIPACLFWGTQFPGTFQLLVFGVHNSRVHPSLSFLGYRIPWYNFRSCWVCPHCEPSPSAAPQSLSQDLQGWVWINPGPSSCGGTQIWEASDCPFPGVSGTRAGPWVVFQQLCLSGLGFNWRNVIFF